MDPYCPYGSPLSWIPIVLDPYCPGSLMSWFHFVLDPSCPGSILSWIHLVLDPSCPGTLLSWYPIVLVPYCPGSILSWSLFVLVPFCPGSILSWFPFVLVPLLSHENRSKRSALARKYRARTWSMEWHWQRTTFPANGPKNEKTHREKITKNNKKKKNWIKNNETNKN